MAPYEMSASWPAGFESLLNGPTAPAPPGHVSDLHAPNEFHVANYVCLVLFTALITGFTLVRLFTQKFLLNGVVFEDYLVVIAWLFQIGETVSAFICIRDGAGKHIWNISLRDALEVKKIANYVGIMYVLGLWFIKLAILFQFLRLFTRGGHNRAMKIACWVSIVLISIGYILSMLLETMQCLPREKIWNPFIVGGHCLSIKGIWGGTGIFNVVSDFAILLLPLPIIYKLQLARGRKMLIMGIFATGIFACVASIMRTYYIYLTFDTRDETYHIVFVGIWTWIEMCIGIMIFCLPVLPQFIHYVRARTSGLFAGLLPNRFGSVSITSLEQTPTPPLREEKSRAVARSFPYVDISLASFEQRPAVRDDFGIHVMKSISFLTERTDES